MYLAGANIRSDLAGFQLLRHGAFHMQSISRSVSGSFGRLTVPPWYILGFLFLPPFERRLWSCVRGLEACWQIVVWIAFSLRSSKYLQDGTTCYRGTYVKAKVAAISESQQ